MSSTLWPRALRASKVIRKAVILPDQRGANITLLGLKGGLCTVMLTKGTYVYHVGGVVTIGVTVCVPWSSGPCQRPASLIASTIAAAMAQSWEHVLWA